MHNLEPYFESMKRVANPIASLCKIVFDVEIQGWVDLRSYNKFIIKF